MSNLSDCQNLKDKLETFLAMACEAEAVGNQMEAERLFRLAIFCEAKMRPDVENNKKYVEEAMPVY